MGLTRSLSTGASSLRAHQQRFDVISNNLANVNTIGYKSSRAVFQDLLSQTLRFGSSPDSEGGIGLGGINPLQFGLGVKIGAVQKDMSQGIVETTNRPLDMALNGEGMFVYQANGRQLYSRAGAVSRDTEGFLVDTSTGAYLQGYNMQIDANGKIVKDSNGINILNRRVDNLQIPAGVISPPRQTSSIAITGNLNAATPEGEERTTSINIFDNAGGTRTLTLTFVKTANDNEFGVTAQIDGLDVATDESTITFNTDGTLNTPLQLQITASDLNAAIGSVVFDETTPNDLAITLAETDNLLGGLTQFGGSNTATMIEQDGYQAGDLISLSVDPEGKVWGAFTNGQAEVLGQVVIAKFTNPEGLVKEGNNFYSISPNSGLANIGTAGENFPSTSVIGAALEQSNVDLTREFTDMIATQRAFEAASRTVTVSDQLLGETTLLKR